ncbi:hypothetical protein WG909_14415 [Peptostreptococcaceae bacterium AGR-M142]
MDYFLVLEDMDLKSDRIFKIPNFTNYSKLLNKYDFDYSKALNDEFLIVEEDFNLKKYKDFYGDKFPIISEKFHGFFKEFFEEVVFKNVIVTDNIITSQFRYYYPVLDKVDCLSSKTKVNSFNEDIDINKLINLDINMVREIILDKEKLKKLDLDAFYIENFKKDYMVVNLYIAEMILRNNLEGIKLKRLKLD